jgi:hypothetical protein
MSDSKISLPKRRSPPLVLARTRAHVVERERSVAFFVRRRIVERTVELNRSPG